MRGAIYSTRGDGGDFWLVNRIVEGGDVLIATGAPRQFWRGAFGGEGRSLRESAIAKGVSNISFTTPGTKLTGGAYGIRRLGVRNCRSSERDDAGD